METKQNSWQPIKWPAKFNHVPKEVFVRDDVYEEELRRIFYGPAWHVIGHGGEIPNKGDFKTFLLAETPLIMSRDEDGNIQVFYNSCSHRGNQLETAPCGNKLEFECPYHRWLFDSKGELIGCPSKDQDYEPGFSRSQYPLQKPRVALFRGLVFVTFSPDTVDLDSYLGDAAERLEAMLGDGRIRLLGYQKVVYKTNWKAYNDNDAYHAPLLHTAFRMMNWQGGKGSSFATEKFGHWGITAELALPKTTSALKDPSIIEFRGGDLKQGSRVINIFPTFAATMHIDTINLRFASPRDLNHTEVHYAYFYHEDDTEEMIKHRLRQSSNLLGPSGMVSAEDASMFHRVHIGSHTPGAAVFQKGVKDLHGLTFDFNQNDESMNLPRWEYYRELMGYERDAK